MKIENNAGLNKLTPSSQQATVENTNTDHAAKSQPGRDSSHVSSLAKAIAQAREVADQLPDVRDEKIALAKQRLASGYYDTPEALEVLVDRLAALVK